MRSFDGTRATLSHPRRRASRGTRLWGFVTSYLDVTERWTRGARNMWKSRVDDVRAAGGAERRRAGNGPGRRRAPTLGSARRDGRGDGVGRRREDGLRAGLDDVRAAGGAERRRAGSAQFCFCFYYCKFYLLDRDGHGRGTNPRRPSSDHRSAASCSCLPGPPCSCARRAEGTPHPATATTSSANQMPAAPRAATRAATRAALGPAAPARALPTRRGGAWRPDPPVIARSDV